jgi:hypothetical protein
MAYQDKNSHRLKKQKKGENAIFSIKIFGLILIVLVATRKNLGKMILNTIIRCLFCLVCVYLCNDLIRYFGGDFSVKINEITLAVSAVFGWSGIGSLYVLQWFFTK